MRKTAERLVIAVALGAGAVTAQGFGSVATAEDPTLLAVGVAVNASSRAAAESQALAACRSEVNGAPCALRLQLADRGYVAVARSKTAFGIGVSSGSANEARLNALMACAPRNSGSDQCKVVREEEESGTPPASAPAPADKTSR